MQTITINFQVPQGWHELGDKQLRYVYQLLAADYSADEVKTLCLLQWSDTKVIGKQPSGAYLLRKGKNLVRGYTSHYCRIAPVSRLARHRSASACTHYSHQPSICAPG
ncbi:MAG: hypothetical protein K2N35_02445 [Muribaculaceae bacterium]|nr:hypothetical protein [Muribaculaceae bacterium]